MVNTKGKTVTSNHAAIRLPVRTSTRRQYVASLDEAALSRRSAIKDSGSVQNLWAREPELLDQRRTARCRNGQHQGCQPLCISIILSDRFTLGIDRCRQSYLAGLVSPPAWNKVCTTGGNITSGNALVLRMNVPMCAKAAGFAGKLLTQRSSHRARLG